MLHAQVSSGVKKSGIYYPREPMGLIALPSKFMQSLDMTFPVFPRTPAAVIFDMDGLLFDTEALYQRAIAAAALEGGYDVAEASPLMIGRPLEQSRQLLSKLYGEVFPVDKFLISMFRHFGVDRDRPLVVVEHGEVQAVGGRRDRHAGVMPNDVEGVSRDDS